MIATVSGAHPFRPTCVAAATDAVTAEDVTRRVDQGQCPRCTASLTQAPITPAGSRATECRCVPVCTSCGAHEALVDTVPIHKWPLATVSADLARVPGTQEQATIAPTDALTLMARSDPQGGALAYGYDDAADRAERSA